MIERYLFARLKPEHAAPSGREELQVRSRELMVVPGVRAVAVGRPADASAQAAWDLSLVVRFETLAEVARYLADPRYESYARLLESRAQVIKAWTFEVLSF